jgi:hypothetical protein
MAGQCLVGDEGANQEGGRKAHGGLQDRRAAFQREGIPVSFVALNLIDEMMTSRTHALSRVHANRVHSHELCPSAGVGNGGGAAAAAVSSAYLEFEIRFNYTLTRLAFYDSVSPA